MDTKDDLNEKLLLAVRAGNAGDVVALIGKGADVNARDNEGRTPMHVIAVLGYMEVAQTLIDAGADVNACIDYSVMPQRYEIEQKLNSCINRLSNGEDLNACSHADTPLRWAKDLGNEKMERIIYDAGGRM